MAAKKKRKTSQKRGLSPKQRLFAKEYLVDLDPAAAYVRAGYSHRGAAQSAHTLLKNPEIDALVKAGMAGREARVERTGDDVVRLLQQVAFADRRELFMRPSLTMKELDALPPDIVASIESISVSRDGKRVKVKLVSKKAAADMLMKHHGKYAAAKREHTGPDGGPIPLAGPDGGPIPLEHTLLLPSPAAVADMLRDLGLPVPETTKPPETSPGASAAAS